MYKIRSSIGNQREYGDKPLERKREFSKFSDYMESILKSMVFYIPAISNKKVFKKKMFREATQVIGYIELYVIKMYKTFTEKMIT